MFYFLFVGGNPLYGKKTEKYLLDNGYSEQEAADIIYGKDMALFAFDPKDTSNSLKGCKDPANPHLYEIQIKNWERVPSRMKALFFKTFSAGLKDPKKRASDEEWIHVFDSLLADTVRCRNRACRRVNFAVHEGNQTCIYCGSRLPLLKEGSLPDTQGLEKDLTDTQITGKQSHERKDPVDPSDKAETRKAVFHIVRDISSKPIVLEVTKNKSVACGIYPGLPKTWIKFLYKHSADELAAVNQTNMTWQIRYRDQSFQCRFGQGFILRKDMYITVLPGKLALRVVEV